MRKRNVLYNHCNHYYYYYFCRYATATITIIISLLRSQQSRNTPFITYIHHVLYNIIFYKQKSSS
jgi:hypothetical protein